MSTGAYVYSRLIMQEYLGNVKIFESLIPKAIYLVSAIYKLHLIAIYNINPWIRQSGDMYLYVKNVRK